MSIRDSGVSNIRRRGAELEESLLDAAWEQLVEIGYGGFTMEAVATRAGTSRAVLYRRWPNRWDLAIDAIRRRASQNSVALPDKGNLRDDLLTYLLDAASKRLEFAVILSMEMDEYFQDTKASRATLREKVIEGRSVGIETLFERAVARGEIDGKKLTPRIASLPTDLLRHELLMAAVPLSEETIREIVDTIFLPLVRP